MTITRRTRLHRAPTLSAFRATLAALIPLDDIEAARTTAVIVPSRSAGEMLLRTLEDRRLGPGGALVLPDLVTRRDWYERLHERALGLPRMLTEFEREVLVEAASHEAITEGDSPPFHVRPALVGEIVALYDALGRQRKTVADFERELLHTFEEAADFDRGAERLLRQTRFLARVFRGYERRLDQIGELDEHRLRAALLATGAEGPYRRVIVTVGDEVLDVNGLWKADFDLLTRLAGLEGLDVVATEEQLATGWLERVHERLPELEEVRAAPPERSLDVPVLVVPRSDKPTLHFESRDREEELADLVRRIRVLHRSRPDLPLDRIAVVFGRPLPYVYLARGIFESGGVAIQSRDALPLAAEPFAAALDLVFSAIATGFSAGPLSALLRSPHFVFADAAGDELSGADLAALDLGLAAFDSAGDPDRLESLAEEWASGALRPPRDPRWHKEGAARAARTAASAVRALQPLAARQPASHALQALLAFLGGATRPLSIHDPLRERHLRARRAVLAILDGLKEAHARHHDLLWTIDELAATTRRWIESETFTPARGRTGVILVDRAAAAFGDFADLHLVGLVDGEWPERARRNIFYSQRLLARLDWPEDPDRTAESRGAFIDLLQSPSAHVSLSSFSLEDDALVERSPLIADAPRAGLSPVTLELPRTLVFAHEAFAARPVAGALDEPALSWVRLRQSRPDFAVPEFHGSALPPPPRTWSVSAIELYAQCPFKFYARYVLVLGEERPDDEGLTPLERGRLIHEVFERFYAEWQARGHRGVTAELLATARALAGEVLEVQLAQLSPSDQIIERTRFLGSPVAPGLIDVVLRMEAEREIAVVERWLEHRLDGTFRMRGADGERDVRLRGIADRVDLLADGTFRVIDYKSSRASGPLQLAIYATALRQTLISYRGRDWALGEAAYVAFRDDPPVRPLARTPADLEEALLREEGRLITIVDGISRGEFPPQPADRGLCATCAWSSVCRKDYVERDASPSV